MGRWTGLVGFAALAMAVACGGDDEPTPGIDGGHDDGGDTPDRCENDEDCADSRFCNGAERCAPAATGADARGCVTGADPCEAGQTCSESERACTAECEDFDQDGYTSEACGGPDCDDRDERRFPTNTEVCDAEGVDEDCNPETLGEDRDADGFVSERCCNYLPTGRLACGEDCNDDLSGVNPGAVDLCGGGDQDCDDAVDENPDGTFYRDVDGDGFGVAGDTIVACSAAPGYAVLPGDCDDTRSGVNPGVGELCNLRDDNCDGSIDEGCSCSPDGRSESCGESDVGACRLGSRTCVAGEWSACAGAVGPVTEVCEGSADENCDGMSDEGCACVNGETRLCGMSIGVCRAVQQTCSGGQWPRACADEPGVVSPSTEECDGTLDQDCDGAVDEGCACTNGAVDRGACGTDTGECVSGMRTCAMGAWGACSGGVGPATEACDGARDEDCDNAIDEGCSCTNGTTRPCGLGECAGTQTCVAGSWAACDGGSPAAEVCNGLDDDCDGRPDASDTDVAMVGTACGTDVGLCTTGLYSCPGTMLECSGIAAIAEACDHRDQDCDGLLDDGVGPATCSFSAVNTSSLQSEFTCSWGTCSGLGGSIRFGDGSIDEPGRIAVLRASELPDWGRQMSVSARFSMAWQSGGVSDWASGRFGVIVSPVSTPTSEGSTSNNNAFPALTGTQRGIAVVFVTAPNVLMLEIWELTPTGAIRRETSSLAPSSCTINHTGSQLYTVTLSTSAESISARLDMSEASCADLTATYALNATTWLQNVYGNSETADFPRYQVGAYGDNDGFAHASLTRFDVTRTRTSDRTHCVACPW